MKYQAALILTAFLFICGFSSSVENVTVQASDESAAVAERASTQGSTLAPVQEDQSSNASLHFEPLLLLLLGSTLFSIGTAIKLVLSRKLDPKQLGATRKPPSPQC